MSIGAGSDHLGPDQYEPMTLEEFTGLLVYVNDRVAAGDSFEGFINYLMPNEGDPLEVRFRVHARIRVGNLQGQGSMVVVGSLT